MNLGLKCWDVLLPQSMRHPVVKIDLMELATAYLQDVLNKIGLNAKLKIINAAVYWTTIGSQATKAQIGFADWFQDYPHPLDWYDVLLNGTLSHWAGMEAAASPEVRRTQRLMIAPTDHAFTPTYTGRIGRLEVSPDGSPFDQVQHFFDYWLRGEQNGVAGSPRVCLYDIGRNEWRQADEWPPSWVTPTSLYLHGRGRAAAGACSAGGALRPCQTSVAMRVGGITARTANRMMRTVLRERMSGTARLSRPTAA